MDFLQDRHEAGLVHVALGIGGGMTALPELVEGSFPNETAPLHVILVENHFGGRVGRASKPADCLGLRFRKDPEFVREPVAGLKLVISTGSMRMAMTVLVPMSVTRQWPAPERNSLPMPRSANRMPSGMKSSSIIGSPQAASLTDTTTCLPSSLSAASSA